MKTTTALLISMILSIGLSPMLWAKPINIVAITQDFGAIAKAIGGNHVKVSTLVKGSRNLHNITPKPSMIVSVRKADLLIRLGMSQDSWIDGLIQVARNGAIFPGQKGYIDCSTQIDKLEIPEGKLDGRRGDVHKDGNPHYWLNPKNGIIIAKQIRDHLSAISPENRAIFDSNYATFTQNLNQKITQWQEKMAPLNKRPFLSYHKVWSYFFEAFGLTQLGELEPLPGVPPTVHHLATLQTLVRNHTDPPIILTANYYPSSYGDRFAATVGGTHVVLKPQIDGDESHTYTDLFDNIIDQLRQ